MIKHLYFKFDCKDVINYMESFQPDIFTNKEDDPKYHETLIS